MSKSRIKRIHLMIVDPQNDFVDPKGSLPVPGADADMNRLAAMVDRLGDRIDDVHVTLDAHRILDISHPIWFKDAAGRHPAPFTCIGAADLRTGAWVTTRPGTHKRTLAYLEALEKNGRYPHVIWPEHCLIGTAGSVVWPRLMEALHGWERRRHGMIDAITKGSNPWTEHFSGVQAEVPDPEDPTTQVNTGLIRTLEEADVVLIAGEALSHCVANTVRDVAANFADPAFVRKLVLLTDASSNVAGFEHLGKKFMDDLTALGMTTATTTNFLAS